MCVRVYFVVAIGIVLPHELCAISIGNSVCLLLNNYSISYLLPANSTNLRMNFELWQTMSLLRE